MDNELIFFDRDINKFCDLNLNNFKIGGLLENQHYQQIFLL